MSLVMSAPSHIISHLFSVGGFMPPRLEAHLHLPSRCRLIHGVHYYDVPRGSEAMWDGKKLFRLGKTYREAMDVLKSKAIDFPKTRESKLLTMRQIVDYSKEVPRSGVYFLIKDEKIVYIGRSKHCPYVRISSHITNKVDFDRVYILQTEDAIRLEKVYIATYRPIYNLVQYSGRFSVGGWIRKARKGKKRTEDYVI